MKKMRLIEPINPWLKHDIQRSADCALDNIWMLPTGVEDMSKELNWGYKFSDGGNSKQLWLHSLPFIDDLVVCYLNTSDDRYINHAIYLIENYFDWISESNSNKNIAWRDEHAVSNRACVMARILHSNFSNIEKNTLNKIFIHAIDCARFLADPVHYVRNNHGLMMDRSLFQFTLLLDYYDSTLTGQLNEWQNLALSRTFMMLDATFDSLGCCTENSPAYQFVNIDIFQNIADFYEAHGFSSQADKIMRKLESARSVAGILLRDDGSVPMIGDTVLNSSLYTDPRVSIRYGSGYYPESGFYIYKSKRLNLTLKCGGVTHTHRHVDDTSITCRYLGVDLIVDNGLFNYDKDDRHYFFSAAAHSGIFFDDCYGIRRIQEYSDPKCIASMLDYYKTDGVERVFCESSYFENSKILRTINVIDPNLIFINDEIFSEEKKSWIIQFNLHPDCAIELKDKIAIIRRAGVGCEFIFYGDGHFSIKDAWYSESFSKKLKSKQLFIAGSSSHAKTIIRFFGANETEIIGGIIDDNFLTTSYPLVQAGSNNIQIDPCAWQLAGDGMDLKYKQGMLEILADTVGKYSYIQSGPGSFEKINKIVNSKIAAGTSQCVISYEIEFCDPENLASCDVKIFFMQYSHDRNRVSNEKINVSTGATIAEKHIFTIAPNASYYKIAIRIANCRNTIKLRYIRLNFS